MTVLSQGIWCKDCGCYSDESDFPEGDEMDVCPRCNSTLVSHVQLHEVVQPTGTAEIPMDVTGNRTVSVEGTEITRQL